MNRHKKTCIVILAFLVLTLPGYATAQHFKYRTVREGKDLSFPILQDRGYPAAKINQLLQMVELRLLKGHEEKSIFELAAFDDGTIYGGKVDLKPTIYHNSDRFFSVGFREASCGATCHYWVQYYTFNSGNGDMVQLSDLFTTEGYAKFFQYVTAKRIAKLKREIRKLDVDEQDSFFAKIYDYQMDELNDFYIKSSTLYIDGENSFLKNEKFSGIETVSAFRLREFSAHLNDYGKCFFSVASCSIGKYRSDELPQLFHGTIAGQKVVMALNFGIETEMLADYVYSRYGKTIFVEGEFDNGKLTMIEKGLRNTDNGFIDAVFDGAEVSGTWTSKDRTGTYELSLKRM